MIRAHIFDNLKIQKQVEGKGYAVFPFADRQMLGELQEFYRSLNKTPQKGTHVTMFNPSPEYRKLVDNKIKEVCEAKARQIMKGHRVLYTNFMVKEPGHEGDFPLHQDWTYVDETENASYALWIPLQDVDEQNEALHVVKGSHRFLTALRGPHVHEPFSRISRSIREMYSVPVKLRAGEALVWDHRLIHFSEPNLTAWSRLAFTLIMVPEGVQVIHCFGNDAFATGEIEIFKVDTGFFMSYVISKRPEAVPVIRKVIQARKDFSLAEFEQQVAKGNLMEWES